MKVDLFIPCFIDKFYPDTGFNLIKILDKLGIEYYYNKKQTCCGQPFYNSGYWDDALDLARKFMKDFPNERPILSPSASCVGYIKNHYPNLSDDESFLAEHNRIKSNIFEITDYLVNHLHVEDLGASFNAKVTYHDSCSALREYGIKEGPRKLLNKVKGLELIEMEDTETCCGFGGTFMFKFKSISTAMAQQKIENALKTGAEYVVSTDSSCYLNLESYIKKQKIPLKTLHILDVISSF